jgi:hypothetical protein
MVKIFTMVKDEVDIVREWIIYHGDIFGYSNLYIIDNYSSDGTWELLQEYKNTIHIYRLPNYNLKGKYMTLLIQKFCKNEFAFPVDIDEFIVLYNKKDNSINCDTENIMNYLYQLKRNISNKVYKMNYIQSKILKKNGCDNAIIETTNGNYDDRGSDAKTFVFSSFFKDELDHGNHYHTNSYILSHICLVHYHCRNLQQMCKKIYNNVKGLGYPVNNINELRNILIRNPQAAGNHHIQHRISVLNKTYRLPVSEIGPNDISLIPISEKISNIEKVFKEPSV